MSKLFGVTVDYLIKDEIEVEEVVATSEENKVGARRVTETTALILPSFVSFRTLTSVTCIYRSPSFNRGVRLW